MDHRILFQIMKECGFQDSYINTCKQLYEVLNTYYMTIHGNSATPPPSRSREEHSKRTPYPHSYSTYSWSPSYYGSPWGAEDTTRPTNPTRAHPLSSHALTTAAQATLALQPAQYKTSKYDFSNCTSLVNTPAFN